MLGWKCTNNLKRERERARLVKGNTGALTLSLSLSKGNEKRELSFRRVSVMVEVLEEAAIRNNNSSSSVKEEFQARNCKESSRGELSNSVATRSPAVTLSAQ